MQTSWVRWVFVCAVPMSLPVHAADIGGWFADQQKARAHAASAPPADTCPQVVAAAAADATAVNAYNAGLCYLQAERPDTVAGKAWMARAAEQNFLPAQRLLRALQIAEAGSHSPAPHCHDLGDGRHICHGGAPVVPVAAAKEN